MVIYDDFLGTALDTTKWDTYQDPDTTLSVADGRLNLGAAAARIVYVVTKKTTWKTGIYKTKGRQTSAVLADAFLLELRRDPNNYVLISQHTTTIISECRIAGVTSSFNLYTAASVNTEYIFEVEVKTGQLTCRVRDAAGNLPGEHTWALDLSTGHDVLLFCSGAAAAAASSSFDWVDVPAEEVAAPPEGIAAALAAYSPIIIAVIVVIAVAIGLIIVMRRRRRV